MKIKHIIVGIVLTAALGGSAIAQTTTETKVSTEMGTKDGMPTKTTKVEHIRKHKTHRAKKILGVKVGHKTRVSKTVKETTTAADGSKSTTTKTINK